MTTVPVSVEVSGDAFWALVNAGVMIACLAGYGVALWLNARANRQQMERLERAQFDQAYRQT